MEVRYFSRELQFSLTFAEWSARYRPNWQILERAVHYISYYIYVEAQSGFRKNMGTIDNIFIMHGIINHLLNENKKNYSLLLLTSQKRLIMSLGISYGTNF